MKPYLVYQYLLRMTDENHVVTAEQICGFLNELGVYAERRSIYKDIDSINDAIWILENQDEIDIKEDIIETLNSAKEEGIYEKVIIYDSHRKGFYVSRRKYEVSDIRLISECIYSSKYISQAEAERFVDIMREFVSDYQAEEIHTDAFVVNRVRTLNKATINNIATLNDAMSKEIYGEKHVPEKISFKYLKYNISDLDNMIERKDGAIYVVNPFKLVINDGNYYLLGFDDDIGLMRTYRVDRMKSLKRIGIDREYDKEFYKIDLNTYIQSTFSMFRGKKENLMLRFRMSLLDTAIEKFGKKMARYTKNDDHHFTVSVDIEVSDQFFGWLCGFGTGVQIIAPKEIKDQYKVYLEKILNKY